MVYGKREMMAEYICYGVLYIAEATLRGCILTLCFVENHLALKSALHLRLPIFFYLALHGLTASF